MLVTSDLPLPVLWAMYNSAKPVSGGQFLTAWGLCDGQGERSQLLKETSYTNRTKVKQLVEVFGYSRAVELASRGIPSNVAATALGVQEALAKYVPDEDITLRQLGEWIASYSGLLWNLKNKFPSLAGKTKSWWRRLAYHARLCLPFPETEWQPPVKKKSLSGEAA